MNNDFYYLNGEIVSLGDRVLVGLNRYATVTKIIVPYSDEAYEFAYAWDIPSGGVLLDFDDKDRFLVTDFHEDFELIARASPCQESLGSDSKPETSVENREDLT